MDIQIITGRAGSGKSHQIIEMISKEAAANPFGPPLLLLVPDQAAFTMETWLTTASLGGAHVRAQVLSFRRLAHQARMDLDKASARPMHAAGKYALFAQAYADVSDQLTVLLRPDASAHYMERLLHWLEECQLYAHTPIDLANSAKLDAIDPFLAAKLADMSLLYDSYQKRLRDTFVDSYDLLPFLVRHAHVWPFLRDAQIFVDGFVGFTAQELQVIQSFLTAPIASMTLTIGAPLVILSQMQQPLSLQTPFAQAQDTFRRVIDILEKATATEPFIKELAGPSPRFSLGPRLAHLEQNVFTMPGQFFRSDTTDKVDDLRLAKATTKQAEVDGIIADMLSLKREHTLRFSDFVCIVPSLSLYASQMMESFAQAGVPFYMDERRTLRNHPLAVFLLSALRASATGLKSEDVFLFLKTDVFPLPRFVVDRLENYALAHGLSGEDWLHPIQVRQPKDKPLEEARKIVADILFGFVEKLGPSCTMKSLASALWELLMVVDAPNTMARFMEQAKADGDLVVLEMHEKAYDAVVQALDDFVAAFGDESITLVQAQELILRVFDGVTVGLIPAQVDQVMITEVNRVRAFEAQAVFVLGAAQGLFPQKALEDEVLSDAQREWLLEAGVELSPSTSRKQLFERYRVYLALTRATRFLTISYPVADEGSSLLPSVVLSEIRRLFAIEDVPWRYYRDALVLQDDEDYRLCVTPQKTARFLAGALRDFQKGQTLTPLWYAAYDIFANRLLPQEFAKTFLVGLAHRVYSETLPPVLAQQVFGTNLVASVSRLELFARCSFAHFATYGLRLKEREHFTIDQTTRGSLMHAILHDFVSQLKEDNLPWGSLTDAMVEHRLFRLYNKHVEQFRDQMLTRSARARQEAKQVYAILLRALWVLTEHARRSAFVPYQTELSFGDRERDLAPMMTLSLPKGTLRLKGRIDRVDIAQDTDKVWYRVIDYKSSEHKVSLLRMYHGLMLQLPLYAKVLEPLLQASLKEDVDFAGMFYFPLMDPIATVNGPTQEPKTTDEFRKGLRMRGLLRREPRIVPLLDASQGKKEARTDLFPKMLKQDGDFSSYVLAVTDNQWQGLTKRVQDSILKFAIEMMDGETSINPYWLTVQDHACAFCEFHAVCHFEPTHGMGSYRNLPVLKEDAIASLLDSVTKGGNHVEDMV